MWWLCPKKYLRWEQHEEKFIFSIGMHVNADYVLHVGYVRCVICFAIIVPDYQFNNQKRFRSYRQNYNTKHGVNIYFTGRRTNITKEQRQLVTDNHNLIYSFLAQNRFALEDYYDLAAIGLCKASATYQGGGAAFSTYAYKCMLNEVRHEKRKNVATKRIPHDQILSYDAEVVGRKGDTESFVNFFIASDEDIENEVLSKIMLDEYAKALNDKNKQIFLMLIDGYKQTEICKIVGCSQPKVSRVKSKLKNYLSRED